MDNLTHSLFALTLARTPLSRAGRGTTAALLLASNLPDADIVTAFMGGRLAYLEAHRSLTHGPLGIAGLSFVVAALAKTSLRATRQHGPDRQASYGSLVGVALLGLVCHVLMDFPTSYGTRLLSPFSPTWFAVDWMPIVDIYLLLALIGGLIVGAWRPSVRARAAAVVLLLVAGDYALRATLHQTAIRRAGLTRRARWIERWRPERGAMDPSAREPAALPTFLSPFRWTIVQPGAGGYYRYTVDLLEPPKAGDRPTPSGTWVSDATGPWVDAAAQSSVAQAFLHFTRFPVAEVIPRGAAGGAVVRWIDLRFVDPFAVAEGRARGAFSLSVQMDAEQRVQSERLGD